MTQQTNKYNGSGTRIRKSENGTATNYYYSQGSVLYTEDGSGKGTSLNLHGTAGNIIATGRKTGSGEGYYYYHKDPAGSITNLRDASGASIVSYQYTDFGQTSIYGNADFYNEICYNEAIYDRSTGLYYLNARYYDPEDGRFLSRDSYRGDSGNPSTLHLYTYCANNPVNYEDPSGHIAISRIVGGIIGAAAGIFAGSKIAKKTKAKGWKQAAIIAGCAIGGAVVGVVVGPKVAKVAKKAVKVIKKKLPSKTKISKVKKAMEKPKKAVKKTVSKVKQAISKGKSKLSDVKSKLKAKRPGGKKNYSTGKGTGGGQINNANKGGFGSLMDSKEAARYNNYWGRKASHTGTPNSSYFHYREYKGGLEKSKVIYDEFGRQRVRIDFSNHGMPMNHSNPHIHEYLYGPGLSPEKGLEFVYNYLVGK